MLKALVDNVLFLNKFEKGLFLAAFAFFVVFLIVSYGFTSTGFDFPKPAAGLEAWVKVFQSIAGIVVGLKIAWHFPQLLQLLSRNTNRQDRPNG